MEKIYTIPVNEAFDACRTDKSCGCPLCRLEAKLENDELDTILGASMMEPDIRIKTNRQGFCRKHLDKMFTRKNRLGLALMLESHLDEQRKKLDRPADKAIDAAASLLDECYICSRIDFHFSQMLGTTVYLWESDRDFRDKYADQPSFCIPHAKALLELGKKKIGRRDFPDFESATRKVVFGYYDSLTEDVRWFIKKFDYRYTDEPWNNSRDAVERAIAFLRKD